MGLMYTRLHQCYTADLWKQKYGLSATSVCAGIDSTRLNSDSFIILTLPSSRAGALVSHVVGCVDALGIVGTRVGRARLLAAGGSAIRRLTETSETGHPVHTSAVI